MESLGLAAKRDSDGLMKRDEMGSKIPRLKVDIFEGGEQTPLRQRTVMSDFGNSGNTQNEMIGQDTHDVDGIVGASKYHPEYCGDDYIGGKRAR
jgi:hypothetical protein